MCSPFLTAPMKLAVPPRAQNSSGSPVRREVSQRCVYEKGGAMDNIKRSCCWNQNLLKCRNKAAGFYETPMTKDPYFVISYSCSFPLFANHAEKDGMEGKRRLEQSTVASPSSPSFLIIKLKSEMLVEHSHIRSQMKAVELILFNVSSVLIRTNHI